MWWTCRSNLWRISASGLINFSKIHRRVCNAYGRHLKYNVGDTKTWHWKVFWCRVTCLLCNIFLHHFPPVFTGHISFSINSFESCIKLQGKGCVSNYLSFKIFQYFSCSINAGQIYTQFREYLYLYLCQWKCNHMYAINTCIFHLFTLNLNTLDIH